MKAYVRLIDEGVEVFRPVQVEAVAAGIFRISEQAYDPSLESWEFAPGDVVECEERTLHEAGAEERSLVAVRRLAPTAPDAGFFARKRRSG